MEDGKCVGSFLRFQVLKDTIKVSVNQKLCWEEL
jgi:hypothetical protein